MRKNSTLAALAFLLLASPVLALAATPTNCPTLARTLARGARGTDVSALQQFLVTQGLLTSDSTTGYFGNLTQAAVQKFQTSQSIVSSGTPATTGYGSVGPKTRAAIAQACTSTLPSQTSSATTTPPPSGGGGGGGGSPPSPDTPTFTINGRAETTAIVCSALSAFNNSPRNAQPTIKNCIDQTPSGGILELPPGVYQVSKQLVVDKSITLRTQGKTLASAKCQITDPTCAEIVAMPSYTPPPAWGMMEFTANNTTVDHIIVNGNRDNRANKLEVEAQCRVAGAVSEEGISTSCSDNCMYQGNVVKNTMCGTGWVVSLAQNVTMTDNTSAYNGEHGTAVSDGFTIWDAQKLTFNNNTAIDNSDIDMVFGGCQNCTISGNTIIHDAGLNQSAFAGLVLHAWPNTSGNYTGTAVTGNSIDCGALFGCGYGFSLGAHAWYDTASYGGTIFNNMIRHAQQGINVDSGDTKPVHDIAIYNNTVSDTAYFSPTQNGLKRTSAYNLEPGSGVSSIDRSRDTMGTTYTSYSWLGEVPNNNGALRPEDNVCGLLPPRGYLTPGQFITSCNGAYTLIFQGDGNVVLYPSAHMPDANYALWSTGTVGKPAGILIMQGEGNLVLYPSDHIDADHALWASSQHGGTYGKPGKLAVQDDGNLVVYATTDNTVMWASCGILATNDSLIPGQSIKSCNGTYTLIFQGDGNVVLYKGAVTVANALWSTGTAGQSAGTFVMQGDGNLVLYKPGTPVAENALWASSQHRGTTGKPGKLAVQDDGNLVVYATADNSVLWTSNTVDTSTSTP